MFAKVQYGDKAKMAADLRDIFRTGQPDYTMETAWTKWQEMCDYWGKDYRAIKLLRNNEDYKLYMTYLNYVPADTGVNQHVPHLDRTPQPRLPAGDEDAHGDAERRVGRHPHW